MRKLMCTVAVGIFFAGIADIAPRAFAEETVKGGLEEMGGAMKRDTEKAAKKTGEAVEKGAKATEHGVGKALDKTGEAVEHTGEKMEGHGE